MSITYRPIFDRLFWPITRVDSDIAILLLAYVTLYTAFIVAGDGVPYVMDNNETFSAFNHAYNLWNFDFAKSMGLADEAVSPYAAAHPVTHTHQGNFPRLFSFLLYGVGARSPESQIWLTTLTIGSASLVMAHMFFRRLGGRLFAAVAVAFLLTNYLMFAQWQVNIYRVWHGFLLFAALLCVHGIDQWPGWRWTLSTLFVFASLFYGELVFAAFVALTAGLYATWVHISSHRRLLLTWLVQGMGAALALAVIVTQLVFYLGWQDFLTDLKLTFVARNLATDRKALLDQLTSFYGSHDIAFFYNLSPETIGSGWLRAISPLFEFQAAYFTPIIVTFCLAMVFAAYVAPLKYPSAQSGSHESTCFLAAAMLLVPGLFLLILVMTLGGEVVLGRTLPASDLARNAMLAVIGGAAAISVMTAFSIQWLVRRISVSGAESSLRRSALAGSYLLVSASFVAAQGLLYDEASAPIWFESLTAFSLSLARMAILAAIILGCIIVLAGRLTFLGQWAMVPGRLSPFLVSGAIAYLITFHLSGGYIVSGYLVRLCPFIIFHISALFALAFFIVIAGAATLLKRSSHDYASACRRAGGIGAAALAAIMIGGWLMTQANAYRLLSPTQFAFADILRRQAASNDGIVSNAYAIPFGLYAKTWAYLNPEFWRHVARSGDAPDASANPYLWLADRRSNPDYNRPTFFVCFAPAASVHEIRRIKFGNRRDRASCAPHTLGFGALEPGAKAIVRLLAHDEINGQWAVFRLNWDRQD